MPTGPKPKADAKRPDKRVHDVKSAPGVGWSHGDPDDKRRKFPAAPVGLMPEAYVVWEQWFSSWWASFWQVSDLGGLRLAIWQYDGTLRGQVKASDYTASADRYGITPKGRQDLRWVPAKVEPEVAPVADEVAARRSERRSKLA